MFSTARTLSLTVLSHGYDILGKPASTWRGQSMPWHIQIMRVRDNCADTMLWINFNPFTRTNLVEASQRPCIDRAWIRARTDKALNMLKPAQ
jgi:hypothetical protein